MTRKGEQQWLKVSETKRSSDENTSQPDLGAGRRHKRKKNQPRTKKCSVTTDLTGHGNKEESTYYKQPTRVHLTIKSSGPIS